jgi:hypothetical protein
LANIGQNRSNDHVERRELRKGLQATYDWLTKEADPAGGILKSQWRDARIYLNVDDACGDWRGNWRTLNELALDMNSIYDDPKIPLYGVRRFLAPYRRMLEAAGVGPLIEANFSHEETMVSDLRERADAFRREGRFIDLLLCVADDQGDEHPVHSLFLCITLPHFVHIWEHPGNLKRRSESGVPVVCIPGVSNFGLRNVIGE